ncbi:MAG: (2Fe-2S) ferredoxin domain-containing protein [Spirochaetia bacterium]|nr:(2Fe-2S) ferredoxin domain-containing protein [Spirochaetia bacterium]
MFKHHIFICTQNKPPMVPSCGGGGSAEILDSFRTEVFKNGLEKDVVVTSSGCVGMCNRGANVVIYPEGKWYTVVKADDVKKIVQNHIIDGNPVEDRNDPPVDVLKNEVGMFQERIKAMMMDAGKL